MEQGVGHMRLWLGTGRIVISKYGGSRRRSGPAVGQTHGQPAAGVFRGFAGSVGQGRGSGLARVGPGFARRALELPALLAAGRAFKPSVEQRFLGSMTWIPFAIFLASVRASIHHDGLGLTPHLFATPKPGRG